MSLLNDISKILRWHVKSKKAIRNIAVIIAVVFLLLIIFFVLEISHDPFKQLLHYDNLHTSTFYIIFGVFGVFATLYGIYLTFQQLKLAEDIIENYEDFYIGAIELFGDKKGCYIQFSGSTLIPGHVVYGNEKHVGVGGDYRKAFRERASEIFCKTKKKENSRLIVPKDYFITYEKFKGFTFINQGKGENFEGKDEQIKEKIREIKHFQIEELSAYCGLQFVDDASSSFLNGFYLSNGRKMIYVMNIHYEQSEIIDTESTVDPVLVGFKTKNPIIIRAFEKRFNRVWKHLSAKESSAETNT